jgi:hypothetical protein
MTLTVSLPEETESRLRAKAVAAGMDLATFAARELERAVATPRSLAELSGPAYQDFLQSGMSDDELGDLLETEKHAMRAEKRSGISE